MANLPVARRLRHFRRARFLLTVVRQSGKRLFALTAALTDVRDDGDE